MASRKPKKEFEFDVALSFAGEDRDKAQELARKLQAKGLDVFYDNDHKSRLWGKRSEEFEKIYGPNSRYVISFVSKHYRKKDWTRFEFDVASEESKRREQEFILPIKLDDSRLLGIHSDQCFLDWRNDSVDDIVSLFEEKIAESKSASTKKSPSKTTKPIKLLSPQDYQALGLICSSLITLQQTHYESLMPEIDWDATIKRLRRYGHISGKSGWVKSNSRLEKVFRSDSEYWKGLTEQWIAVLEPRQHHVDLAVCLTLHYLDQDRLDEAICCSAEIVLDGESGWWNKLYLNILSKLVEHKNLRAISKETRAYFYNALGVCLSRDGKHDDALKWFAKLRQYAKRTSNDWGIGQSYINAGVACHRAQDDQKAEGWYRKSIAHAESSNDEMLLARSLNNYAQLIIHDDINEAERLLKKSIRLKRKCKDISGLPASYIALGNIDLEKDDPQAALKHYRKARSASKGVYDKYSGGLVLINIGSAYAASSQLKRAVRYFQEAAEHGKKYEYADVQVLGLTNLADISFRRKDYPASKDALEALIPIAKDHQDVGSLINAHHGLGIVARITGCDAGGRDRLQKAFTIARKAGDAEWAARCAIDRSRSCEGEEFSEPDWRVLRTYARAAVKRSEFELGSILWRTIVAILMEDSADAVTVEDSVEAAVKCLNQTPGLTEDLIRLLSGAYLWRWDHGDYPGGIRALQEIQAHSRKSGQRRTELESIDQEGACLQELGRYEEALPLHQKVIDACRESGDMTQLQLSLNNIGEAFRHLDRTDEAIVALKESEQLSMAEVQIEEAISTAHNLALAVEDKGDIKVAAKILERCRDRSQRRGLWGECIRAWEGLANMAAAQGRASLAERRYRKAIQLAKRYGHGDQIPRIALNLCRLLQHQGRVKEAVKILSPHKDAFFYYPDSYIYQSNLADCLLDCGRYEESEALFQIAKDAAESVHDESYIGICVSGLADTFLARKMSKQSRKVIKERLDECQNAQERLDLLIQMLDVELTDGQENAASKVFEEARDLARDQKSTEAYIQIHLALGDYEWSSNKGSRENALQAYTAGAVEALLIGIEQSADICSHICNKLFEDLNSLQFSQLEEWEQMIAEWIQEQGAEVDWIVRFMTWPYRYAQRVHPFSGNTKQLLLAIRRESTNEDWFA